MSKKDDDSRYFNTMVVRDVKCERDGPFVKIKLPPNWVWAMLPTTAVQLGHVLETASGTVDVEGIIVRLTRVGCAATLEFANWPGICLFDLVHLRAFAKRLRNASASVDRTTLHNPPEVV